MAAPIARTEVVRDTYFGVTVEDAYRWLEDAGSDEVRGWPEGRQNAALSARPPGRRRKSDDPLQPPAPAGRLRRGEADHLAPARARWIACSRAATSPTNAYGAIGDLKGDGPPADPDGRLRARQGRRPVVSSPEHNLYPVPVPAVLSSHA
jgi:hypothetical protein